MDDKKILHHIGLTQDEVVSYLEKLNGFFKGLSAAEKKVFLASMVHATDVLPAFDSDLTAPDLEKFIRTRQSPSATTMFVLQCVIDCRQHYRDTKMKNE